MEKEFPIAYFRNTRQSGQCELSFTLITSLVNFGSIHEEVTAVRQITDTVNSLIVHVQNKLRKLIKDKFSSDDEDQENQPIVEVPVSLTRAGKKIKPSMRLENLPDSMKNSIEPIILQVFDNKYQLTYNVPVIKLIKLPEILYANFAIQPVKFNAMFTDHQKSSYHWYKSSNKIDWKKVGDKYHYFIQEEDECSYLKFKCVPVSASDLIGPAYEVITENKVEILNKLPNCPFEKRHEYTKHSLIGKE